MATIDRWTNNARAALKALASAVTVLSPAGAAPAGPAPAQPYVLEQQPYGVEGILLRLRDRRTGRTLWSRRTGEVHRVAWADSGGALAVVATGGEQPPSNYRLLYWRAGERVRVLDDLRPLRRMEGLLDLGWSPDDRRLLILGPLSMGGFDVGMGDLWCFDTRTGRSGFLRESAMRARWVGPTRIQVTVGEVVPVPEVSVRERTLELSCEQAIPPPKDARYPSGR